MQSLCWRIHMNYACSVSIAMHANEWLCMYSSYDPPSTQLFISASQNAGKKKDQPENCFYFSVGLDFFCF